MELRGMKKNKHLTRRVFVCALALGITSCLSGCSIFKSVSKKADINDCDFEEESDQESRSEKNVFESERENQKQLSEYVSQTGKTSKAPKKKKFSAGDTFLMSDKAKEIYANTER